MLNPHSLQVLRAQIQEGNVLRYVVARKGPGHVGDHNLSARTEAADSGRCVDRRTGVVGQTIRMVHRIGLTGVYAHSDLQIAQPRKDRGPGFLSKSRLCRDGKLNCVGGARERQEESVANRFHFEPAEDVRVPRAGRRLAVLRLRPAQ